MSVRRQAPRVSARHPFAGIARRLRRRRRARAQWTCARCGAVHGGLEASVDHIAESHPSRGDAPAPAQSLKR